MPIYKYLRVPIRAKSICFSVTSIHASRTCGTQEMLLTRRCAHVCKTPNVVDDILRTKLALPSALPAELGMRYAPLVALWNRLWTAPGRAARVEDDRNVVARHLGERLEHARG
jgi:hypothetical protein